MPRLSKRLQKAIERAEKQARKEALKEPKRKRRTVKSSPEPRSPSGRWIKDEWGEQGEVYFDGKLYWITLFKAGKEPYTVEAYSCGLSEEKWEEYKKHPIRTNLEKFLGKPKRERKSGTSGTKERLSSTQRKTKSTKSSKTRQKKSSRTKSGKTVTQGKRG